MIFDYTTGNVAYWQYQICPVLFILDYTNGEKNMSSKLMDEMHRTMRLSCGLKQSLDKKINAGKRTQVPIVEG